MLETSGFTIALPEGKNLGPQTTELLREARIIVKRKNPRTIEGTVEGFPEITRAIFCRPEQVAELVASGKAQFGITGKDVIPDYAKDSVVIYAKLLYSRNSLNGTELRLFTHCDNPVSTLEALKADRSRDESLGKLAVASEYPLETEMFLRKNRMRITVEPCASSEVMVYVRQYRYGAALVETGTTLTANGLKPVEGGKIFDSCAVLICGKDCCTSFGFDVETVAFDSLATFLGELLKGTLQARQLVYLAMNAPQKSLDQIRRILPALKSPTIQPLANPEFCAISSVVPASDVNGLILRLSDFGATGFVTLPPSTVM